MGASQNPSRYRGNGSINHKPAIAPAFLCPTFLHGGHLKPVPIRDRDGEGKDRVNMAQILTRIAYKARALKSNAMVAGRVVVRLYGDF